MLKIKLIRDARNQAFTEIFTDQGASRIPYHLTERQVIAALAQFRDAAKRVQYVTVK